MFQLSTLFKIQKDIGAYYEFGYFTADHGKLIRNEIKSILQQMKRFAVSLADSMMPIE